MILLIDTETHDLEKPRIVEIAVGVIPDIEHINDVTLMEGRYAPACPITIKAMSIHNITNEMVDGMSAFVGSPIYDFMSKHNERCNVVVAHNAEFDLAALENEGISNCMPVIDTLRCVRHLFKDKVDMEHNLQYLKYFLELYKEHVPEGFREAMMTSAHSAAGDVITLYQMFRRMVAKYSIEKLIELTNTPVLHKYMPFGKHKGKIISDIVRDDKGYTTWVLNNVTDNDVLYSFKYNMKGMHK